VRDNEVITSLDGCSVKGDDSSPRMQFIILNSRSEFSLFTLTTHGFYFVAVVKISFKATRLLLCSFSIISALFKPEHNVHLVYIYTKINNVLNFFILYPKRLK